MSVPFPSPRVALMQPTFLPWLGYFALMRAADVFVVLDDFQFVRRSFHQRNRLFVSRASVGWITVPVSHEGHQDVALDRVIPKTAEMRAKLVGALRHAYEPSRHRDDVIAETSAWLGGDHASLADLNLDFLERAKRWLGIDTPILRSSALGSEGSRSRRIASILRRVEARTYLSARGAAGYMLAEGVFPLEGIETVFQTYEPETYPQSQSEGFVPYLSALDAIVQQGPERARAILEAGERPFVRFRDMESSTSPALPTKSELLEV